MEELVAIAKIVKTRGLKGELVADLLTDFPERFGEVDNVTAVGPDGATAELTLSDFWFQGGRVILRFAGYDTVEKAESLRNFEICVPESEVVELDEGALFISDPLGFGGADLAQGLPVHVAFLDCEDDFGPFKLPVFARR